MRLCGRRSVCAGLILVCGVFAAVRSATAGQGAQIVVFGFYGSPTINLGVDIPKSVDMQARTGKKSWAIDLTVTYADNNNIEQTIDSGRLDIATQTAFLQSVDGNTDLIQATVSFGSTPMPGPGASFTGTATLIKP